MLSPSILRYYGIFLRQEWSFPSSSRLFQRLSSVHLAFPFLPRSTGQFAVVGALPRLVPALPEKGFGQLEGSKYAMRGYLTDKAYVYGFGMVTLEIVSGINNTNFRPKEEFVYFLDCCIKQCESQCSYTDLVHFLTFPSSEKIISMLRSHYHAYVLQEHGNLFELVDQSLGSNYSKEEALQMLELSLVCTDLSPMLRPAMSSVISMLEGKMPMKVMLANRATCMIDAYTEFEAFVGLVLLRTTIVGVTWECQARVLCKLTVTDFWADIYVEMEEIPQSSIQQEAFLPTEHTSMAVLLNNFMGSMSHVGSSNGSVELNYVPSLISEPINQMTIGENINMGPPLPSQDFVELPHVESPMYDTIIPFPLPLEVQLVDEARSSEYFHSQSSEDDGDILSIPMDDDSPNDGDCDTHLNRGEIPPYNERVMHFMNDIGEENDDDNVD
ncbi:hypothetical protein ZIOFF_054429 [Zingiber officinale]|uniref:Uncharacterized protein n=1 Tax=Zingiber officinale TaxID=94328 RepID=A0A8J5FEH0_ZINOF|nr:hypothetical protein ZIOFF_054429 [Zingiber officinale]